MPDSATQPRSALQTSPRGIQQPPSEANNLTGTNPIPRPSNIANDVNVDIPPANPALSDQDLVNAALAKANELRLRNGASELELDPKLTAAAQRHANDMHTHKFFDHKGPDGKLPPDRVKDAGGSYRAVGENIAEGLSGVEEVFSLWMKSEPHRKSLLEKQFTKHGIGFKDGRWVHLLAE